MQDPETFLAQLGIEIPCAVNKDRTAILDGSHRAWVNHEVFFFSSVSEREAFLEHPERHCGVVTDPVSHQRFRPVGRSPRFDHDGRPYFFLSDATLERFKAAPDSFAVPRLRMIPKTKEG